MAEVTEDIAYQDPVPKQRQLADPHRAKLDSIVNKMIANKESDEVIQSVVNDFKEKYSVLAQPKQPEFQIKLSEPSFGAGAAPVTTQVGTIVQESGTPVKAKEFSFEKPVDALAIDKMRGSASVSHGKLKNELLSNDAQYEKSVREHRRDSYTVENLREDYKNQGLILSPQDEQKILQKEKQKRYDLPVMPEEISDIKTGTILNEGATRKFIKNMNRPEVLEDLYRVDKYNELASDPNAQYRVEKVEDIAKKIGKKALLYDPETRTAIQPLGLIGSIVEGTKNKFRADEEHDFFKNAPDATIINELESERNNPDTDEPLKVPKGKAQEILMSLSEMPLSPIAAGAIGSLAGPQAGLAAGAAVGAYENRKAQYRATFKQVYNELRDQGTSESESLQAARKQADQAQEIGTIVGLGQGYLGAKIGATPLKAASFSPSYQKAIGAFLKQNGSELGKMALEGATQGGIGVAGEMWKNKLAQTIGIKRDIDEGTADQFWGNLFMTVGIGAAMKAGRGMTKANYKTVLHGISKLPESELSGVLQEKVNAGEVTQEAADQTLQRIKEYKEKDAQIPPNVTEDARFKIQDNIDKLNELEAQKEATHKSLQEPIKEKIVKLEEENLGLLKETEKPIKTESGLSKAQEKEAIETAEEFVTEGILPDIYNEMVKKDPIGFWKMVAQQAQNVDENWKPLKEPLDEQSIRDQFGDTIVDYAKELFPAPEVPISTERVSVIQPGEISRPETITIKPKEDAVRQQITDEMDVRQQAGDGQGMGEGNIQPEIPAGTQEGQQRPAEEASATPSQEGQVREPEMVGITHAEMDKVSRELGLPEYSKDPETFESWTREAKDRLAKDPDAMNKLINKLRRGEGPDPVETQMMKMHFAALKGKYNANPTPELLAEITRTKDLYNISGRMKGKELVARKGLMPVDENSLADFHQRDVEYNRGAPLTEKQTAQSTEEFKNISKKQTEFDENKAKSAAKYSKEKAETKVKEWAKTEKKDAKKDYKAERSQILKDIGEKWKKASKESLGASILPFAKELAAIAPDVIKLVKNVIQDGVTELPDIIKSVHNQIKEYISDITEKDVHDIIAGEYSKKLPPRSKLMEQLHDARTEARLINEYEQLVNGKVPKSERKLRQRNQKIEALTQKIKGLKDEMGLNQKDEAQKLAALKGRYKTQIEEIKQKLDKGDYGPDEKPQPIALDEEGKKLRDELLQLKDERNIRLLKQLYEDRSTGEKLIAGLGKGLRTGRQLQSGFFDVSYPFRQTIVGVARQLLALPFKREGGKLVYTGFESQRQLRKQFSEMYMAFGREKNYRRTMADIKEDAWFDVAQKSKLDLAEIDAPLERFKEEEAQQSYAEKIPVAKQAVRMSNRAATVIANKMKFDIFKQLAEGFRDSGKTFENSPELYKEAAIYANKLVGRGFLGEKLEMASPLIGHVLYSLRLQASRLQLLTSLLNLRFYTKVPKEIRIEYIKDMTKFVLMGSAMLGLAKAAGLGVELDPRSSDFGSIRWGDTRFDIWGGFKQYVTLFSRLLTASTKSPETGQISSLKIPFSHGKPERGEKTYGDLLLRFARTKASPEAGTLTDILAGETFDKRSVTARGEIVGYIAPMIIGDVYDAWKDNGVLGAALTYILATHGVGAQSHIKEDSFDDLVSGEDEGAGNLSTRKTSKVTKTKKLSKTSK
jgi:hypothetical protein